MTIQSDMALMAAGSYWDVRKGAINTTTGIDTDNDAPVPAGWKVLNYDISNTGGLVFFRNGFSARVYQSISTGEIVISYAGTEFGLGRPGFWNDFISGNTPLALGLYGDQALQAAELYQRVKAEQGGNISFTGHSLGGGLASVMAVWFDRPAYVFAPAPFERSADTSQPTGVLAQYLSAGVMPTVQRKLGDSIDPAFKNYDPVTQYVIRETNVKAWAVQGEVLEAQLTRFTPFIGWIESTPRIPLFAGSASALGDGDRHSIDLHAAALLSPMFETEAGKFVNALPLLFSPSLYGGDVLGNQQLLLPKLLRNEVGVRDDVTGNVLLGPNGMLSNFALDLQKLGTNIAGLNRAAQDAMIAQGIEWYYWQGRDYTGDKKFFTQTGNLYQYTTAIGDGLTGALNKAAGYTVNWLQAVQGTYGLAYAPVIRVDYSQWNITAGNSASTANARDAAKSQIFISQDGADTFTGGDKDDLFFAGNGLNTVTGGAGNDVIYGGSDKDIQDGGEGNDQLYGGAGDDTLTGGAGNDNLQGGEGGDTYQFDAAWGKDVITDSDGKGTITIGGQTLGTAQGGGKTNVWITELGAGSGQFVGMAVYDDASSSTGKKLIITKGTDTSNTIIINNFDLAAAKGAGYLGIKLDKTQHIALTQGNGTTQGASTPNVYADRYFNPSSLDGKNTQFKEGNGASFSVSLAVGAKAGDTVTLAVNGELSGKLKTRVNGSLVDAGGASLTLKEGQTLASFELVSEGEIEADLTGSISASYSGEESADSNSWDVTVKDAGEVTRTYLGDQRAPLNGDGHYQWSSVTWASDGTLTGGEAEAGFADVIYGSRGIDKISGLGGTDVLSGYQGNDQIDGGDGNDLITGGAGSDSIKGGDGDDVIHSAGDAYAPQRLYADGVWMAVYLRD